MADAASLKAIIGADTSALARGMTQADSIVKQGAQQMQASASSAGTGIGQSLGSSLLSGLGGSLAGMATLGGVTMLLRGAVDLAQYSAQAERVGTAFKTQFGTVAVEGLDRLRRASRGTIDDMNLMLSANKAAMLGVSTDTETLAKLLEVATVRGRALGVGTQQAFSDIVTGIGRMSPLILDNLGIITGGERAMAAYAQTLGKTSAELSDMERKQFLVNKVLGAGATVTDDAAGGFEALTAAYNNYRVALGKDMGGAVGLGVGAATAVINQATQTSQMRGPKQELLNEWILGIRTMREEGSLTNAEIAALSATTAMFTIDVAMGASTTTEMANAMAALAPNVLTAGMAAARAAEQANALGSAVASLPTWTEMHIALTGSIDATAARIMLMQGVSGMPSGTGLTPMPAGVPISGVGGDAWLMGRTGLNMQTTTRDQLARDEAATQATRARIAAGARGGGGGGKSALQKAGEDAAKDARAAVESILTPSQARYVGGAYQDAWDEYVRRLKSAVSDPQSMWKGLLGGRSGDAAKAFAAEEEEAFYNGMRPDNIDWAAFDAQYAHLLEVKRGREMLVQAAMARVGGGNKAEVMAAFGLKGTPVEAGLDLAGGFAVGMAGAQMGKPVTEAFAKQLEGQQKTWISLGKLSMTWFTGGLNEGITKQVSRDIAKAIFPAFFELLLAREVRQ